jgi:nicotinate-nucleotide pyrophosphorylase (carboxylating)
MFELLYRDALRRFLLEDLGVEGDVSGKVLGLDGHTAAAAFVAREAGTVAGLCFVRTLFQELDTRCVVESQMEEGADFEAGASLLLLTGPTAALLAGERTALNLLSRTFGIATQTRNLVRQLQGTSTRLLPTRKTLPGLRFFDKYAVTVGGGSRHRYGLNDAIMIKDNHLAIGGGIDAVLRRARATAGHMLVIEMECDTVGQLQEVLRADREMMQENPRQVGVNVILLDNMELDTLREAVSLVRSHPRTILCEASGGIRGDNLRTIAATGVDFISMGALTHTVIPVDIGLDFLAGR